MASRTSMFRGIRCLIAGLSLLAGSVIATPPQYKAEKPKQKQQDFPKRCNPVIVKKPKPDNRTISVRKGEKPTGYSPLITFQIEASGEVTNIRLKRTSGFKDIDDVALSLAKSTGYNSRPGCPVIEVEESVTVDF